MLRNFKFFRADVKNSRSMSSKIIGLLLFQMLPKKLLVRKDTLTVECNIHSVKYRVLLQFRMIQYVDVKKTQIQSVYIQGWYIPSNQDRIQIQLYTMSEKVIITCTTYIEYFFLGTQYLYNLGYETHSLRDATNYLFQIQSNKL